MKIYVAFRTDTMEDEDDEPERFASPSWTKLKETLKAQGDGAEFTVALFDIKPNVENLCKAIVDVRTLKIVKGTSTEYQVKNGQLRQVKE